MKKHLPNRIQSVFKGLSIVIVAFAFLLLPGISSAQSFRTVTFSGSSSDFNAAEKYTALGAGQNTDYYVTFDATYLYIGAFRTGGSTFGANDNFTVYLDTDPTATPTTAGAGTTAGQSYNGVTGVLPFRADYNAHVEQSYQEMKTGTTWATAVTGFNVFTNTTAREIRIPLSSIGNPDALYLTMWMGYTGGFFANAPGANVAASANPTITGYFGGIGLGSADCIPVNTTNTPITASITNGVPVSGARYGKVKVNTGTVTNANAWSLAPGGSIEVSGGTLAFGTQRIAMGNSSAASGRGTTINTSGTGVITTTALTVFDFIGEGNVVGNNLSIAGRIKIRNKFTPLASGGLTFSSGGSLDIRNGGYVNTNAPTYAAGSFLRYNSGNSYTASTEWTSNAVSGVGVPANVTIGDSIASSRCSFGASTQYRQMTGNLNLAVATSNLTLSSAVGGDLQIGGNVANLAGATLTHNSRTVTFNGTAAQTTNSTALTYGFLTIANTTATVSAGAALTIANNLTVNASARLNLATFGITLTGATATINGFLRRGQTADGALTGVTASTLTFSTTGTYEHNFTTVTGTIPTATWSAGSTCSIIGYTGTAVTINSSFGQAFSNFTWNCTGQTVAINLLGLLTTVNGNFNLASVGTSSITYNTTSPAAPTLTIGGNCTINGSINLNNGTSTPTFLIGGNFSHTGGIISRGGTGVTTITFNKASGTQTISQSGGSITAPVVWNLGNGTSTQTVQFASNFNAGTGAFTVNAAVNATTDFQNFVLSGSGTFAAATGSTLISANTAGFNTSGASGSVQTTTRTFTNAGVNYTFNAASAQVTGTAIGAATNIKNLTVNNASGLTLSAATTLSSTGVLTFTSGLVDLSTFNLTMTSGATFSGQTSAKYVKTSSTGRLVQTVASSAIIFPVGVSAYNPITLTNSGTSDTYSVLVVDAPASPTVNNSTKIVNRFWSVTEGVAGGGSIAVTTQYNSGEPNANFASGTTLNMGIHNGADWSIVNASGAGSNPFTASTNSNFNPLVTTYTIGIAKDDGLIVPAFDFTWTGATSSDWGTATNWDLSAVPAITDNIIIPTSASYTNALAIAGSRTCVALIVNGNGTFSMAASSSINVKGDFTYSSSVAPSFDCSSTFQLSAATSQNVPAFNYGSLNIAGGARVLASSGTIGICGTFTPSISQTVTGSTVNFNGSGSQTIAAATYNNLTISNARGSATLTLPSGTIAVGGTFNVSSLSAYSPSVNAASIFDFTSASAQNIPAFFYGQISNTGNGSRTWAATGIIDVNQAFSAGTGTHTITGSTMQFSGSGTYPLATFTTNVASRQFNNLNITGAGGTWQMPGQTLGITGNLSISNGTFRIANGVTATNNATFNVDGNLSISGGTLDIAGGTTAIGTFNLSGDFSQTGGTIQRSASTAAITSTINLVKASGIQTINQTGGAANLTNLTFGIGNGTTTTNTVRLLSNLYSSGAGAYLVRTLASLDFQTFIVGSAGAATFTTQTNSSLITANTEPTGAFNINAGGLGSVQVGGARTFVGGTNYTYNGSSDQYIGFSTATPSVTIRNLTINTSGGAKVILNPTTNLQCEFYVDSTLTLTNGVLFLSAGRIYVRKDVVGNPGFGTSNMIVTNQGSVFPQRNPGQFRRYMPTAAAGTTQTLRMTIPLGDLTGTTEYTPLTFDISYTAGVSTVATPYIGFKCIDNRNPYDASLTDYMTRYWIVTTGTAFNNAATVSLNVRSTYKNPDVIGNEAALKMNRFNTTTLQNTEDITSYTDPSNDTLYSATLDKTMITDHDLFARKTVNLYFRSNASGKWQNPDNWLISSDPAFVSPAGVVPPIPPNSANSDSIAILSGHVMVADTVFPPYTMDQALIEGTLNVATGSAMYFANGPGSLDVQVTGTFSNAGTQVQLTGSTMRFGSSGIYLHATPTSTVKIPNATWDVGSLCKVTGLTTTVLDVTSLNQAFSDFTWECAGQTASLNLAGGLTNVGRDLKIVNSGAFNLGLVAGTGSLTLNVGRNFEVSGGNVVLTTGAISPSINVSGDLIVSSGTLDFNSGTGSSANLNLSGNFSLSGGIVRKSSGTNGNLNFVKATGTQTINQTGGTVTNVVNFNIGDGTTTTNTVQLQSGFVNGTGTITAKSGATLDFQTNVISGSGTFTTVAGTTLKTASTDATGAFVTAPTAAGSVQTSTRVFSVAGVNYIFNGASAQIGGNAFGVSAINNLEINNASGLSLSTALTINGTTTFTDGLVNLGANDVTLGASAAFSGQGAGRYFKTSSTGKLKQTVAASAKDFPVGNSAYNPIQLTNSGTSDVFGIQVLDVVSSPVANDPSKIINRYWQLTENVSGGSNISVTAQYNLGEEATNFNAASNPVMGLYSSTAPLWKYQSATSVGSGPVTYTASFTSFTGTTYHIGLGKDDAFNCSAPPTITSFSPSSAYAGETITLTGSGLSGLTSATIGGTAALISTQSGSSATLTVQEGSTGTIFLTSSPGCGDFSSTSFTFSGYKSAQTGNWGTASTWLGSYIPVTGKPVLIANGHNVTSDVAATPSTLTVETGGTLTLSNSANLGDLTLVATINGTLICPSSVTNPANGIQAASLTVANGAVFTNSAGNSDAVAVTTFNVNAGGTYNHDAISSSTNANTFDFPGATNNLDAAGNINITKWGQNAATPTAPFPTPASGTYGNLTINITTQTYLGAWNLQGGIPATANFTINGTGGRELRLFANSNTGTLNVNGNLNITGGTTGLINSSSANTGSATMNITGNMSISGGTFDLTGTGAPTSGNSTVNLSGDLTITGSGKILRSIANSSTGVSTFRFNKTSGTQTFSANDATSISTHPMLWEVGNGTTAPVLNLGSNMVINTGASLTTKTAATLNCGTFNVAGTTAGSTGTFVLQSGATLGIGSADGITAATAATGNIQTNTRTFNAAGNYNYNGAVNQTTGNGLPSTITGNLSISNTGTSGSNTVSLTTTGTTVSTLNLSTGLFAIGSGQNLNLANAGLVNATGGDFASGVTGGTITATGSAVFNGTSNPYNVYAAGGVNFGAQTVTIQNGGAFRINAGGFVNTNAPYYGTGSTLEYNSGGNYDRGLEWNSSTGRGAPFHVSVNTTTLVPAKTGAAYASTTFNTLGDLTIAAGGNIYMDYFANNMTVPLNIGGNLILVGGLSASNASGGDINLAGNWTNNGTGSNFNANNRQVAFNGASAQTIDGSNSVVPAFAFLSINNTAGDVTTTKNLTVTTRLQMNSGKLIIGNNNISIGSAGLIDLGGASSYIVTNGTGTVTQNVSGGTDWYPVGPSTTVYGPVTLNQSGTADNISVRVVTAPAFTNAVNDNNKMVNLEWVMTEGTAGGNNLATTFGWSASSEAASFDRTAGVFHGNHNGTRYVIRAGDNTTGADPYFSLSATAQPYVGNLSAQRFVVGNIAGILPCLQTSAAGNWNSSSNWLNGIVPPLSSNVCIAHAMTLSSAAANPAGVTFETGGSISISNGTTLTLESPGTITNSSGSLLNLTTGTIAFSGLGIVNGANAIGFNNLELNGNTTLTTTPTINGTLEIKPGGFLINATGPNYGASSTLLYNTGGSYNRSNEWNASSGAGYPASVQVSGNTSLDISSGAAGTRSVSGNVTIDAGSSLTQGSSNQGFIVPGNFNLDGSYTMSSSAGGDLVVSGNWNSGASASLTHNSRDIRFDGAGAQTVSVANSLQFGFITIDNSGTGVDLLNPITVNTFRVNAGRTFNMSTNKIVIAAGGNMLINGTFNASTGTVEYTNGGNFTNNGTFNRGTSTLDFVGSSAGIVTGTVQTNFHNIRLFPGGGVDFGSGALRGKVSGTLQLRAGSYVSNNSPIYEAGSKLMYSGGGTFNRNVEWDPSTVQKVEITNNTTLKCGTNGTSFTHSMADSLIVRSGSTLDMTGPNVTSPVSVGGHILNDGTITLSGSIGGDLNVSGDFVNNGTFNANDRAVSFTGLSDACIKGSSNTIFHYLTVNKSAGKFLTATVPFSIGTLSTGSVMHIAGGTFDLNNQALTFLSGSHSLRIDAGFANGQTLKTGGTSITGFAFFRSSGSNSDTLGGKIDYSGSGSETLVSPVKGYNLLWITGAASKSIAQNTIVNDSLFVASGTTLTFGATSSVLEVRGNVVNNGSITGSGSGKVEMKNTSLKELSGNGTIRNLDIHNAAGVNIYNKPTISNALNLVLGKATTITDTIVLGSAASITEDHSAGSYVVGNMKTTRVVNSNAESFGGMGIQLTAGADLGTVDAIRTSGVDGILTGLPLSPDTSISWNWTITPSIQPSTANRNLTLSWPASEDNGRNISAAQIWKRSTILDPWEEAGGIQTAGGTATTRSVVWNNVTGFSQFTVGENNIPLALDLLSFAATKEKNYANVEWRVAETGKASSYVLEKSVDNGRNYYAIETRSAGAPEGKYSARDYQFITDTYYRILVINLDGSTDHSKAILLKAGELGGLGFTIYPNPATGNAGILLNADKQETAKALQGVRVFSLEGRLVINLNGNLSEINSALEAQSSRLPNGVYQLRLESSTGVETIRFIKN